MERLSYSAHLSRKNSAINSKAKLAGVAKHNLRKYRSNNYDKENIVILCGTDKLVQDVKKVYMEQFSEAVEEYNKKQTREERKIHDYFEKTAKSNKDMAVELIFQIGDKEFWDKRRRMDLAFKEILELLQKFSSNLVVANAVIHYDEASPHMHVVAVPVAGGFKKGMSKQVSKRKVCTKEFLEEVLQGKIRECVDNRIFVWLGEFLKSKQTGRNNDLSVVEYKVKKENEKYEKLLEDKKQVNREIGQKIFENQMAEQKLENTYKKIDEVEALENWGETELNKFEKMIFRGPEEPKGLMSAKAYREKVVMPFLGKVYDIFKKVVDFTKKCFVELMDITEKNDKISELNKKLKQQNSNLIKTINKQEEEITNLYYTKEKLEYFKRFLQKETYDNIIRMGDEQDRKSGRIR